MVQQLERKGNSLVPYLPWNVTLSPDDVFLATSIAHTSHGPEMVDVYRRRAGVLWSMQGVPEFLDQERLRGLAKLHKRTCAMADAIEERINADGVPK